jgi:hypothetical protein
MQQGLLQQPAGKKQELHCCKQALSDIMIRQELTATQERKNQMQYQMAIAYHAIAPYCLLH